MIPEDEKFIKDAKKAVGFNQRIQKELEGGEISEQEYYEKKKAVFEYLEELRKEQLELMKARTKQINEYVIELDETFDQKRVAESAHKQATHDLFEEKKELEAQSQSVETSSNEEYLSYLGKELDELVLGARYKRKKREQMLNIPQKRPKAQQVMDSIMPKNTGETQGKSTKTNLKEFDWPKLMALLIMVAPISAGAYLGQFMIGVAILFLIMVISASWIGSMHFTTTALEFDTADPYRAFKCLMLNYALIIPVLVAEHLMGWVLIVLPIAIFLLSVYCVNSVYGISYPKSLVVAVNSLFFTCLLTLSVALSVLIPFFSSFLPW